MEELLNEYGVGKEVHTGDILEGKIIGVSQDSVTVNIGFRSDGIVPSTELPEKSTSSYKEGDIIEVFVQKLDNGEGLVLLSAIKALDRVIWDEFENLKNTQTVVELKIGEVVKGGVTGLYKGFRVFVPASRLGLNFVEDMSVYVGQTLPVVITDVTKEKKSVVASNRVIEKQRHELAKKEAIKSIKVGDRLTGKVARLESYGAFVELGEVDGLLHVSQMSFKRIKHPSEVVEIGQSVGVEVIAVDLEKEKVSLKLTDIAENPWNTVSLSEGDTVNVKVLRISPFGAFVEVVPGVEGLIHISQLSSNRVEKVEEVLNIGDEVEARVLSIDKNAQKLSLSIKPEREKVEKPRVEKTERPEKSKKQEVFVHSSDEGKPTTLADVFGDKLKKFIK